jgi:pyrroline-5-carboxylate reductase
MVEGWQRAGVDLSSATAFRPSGKNVAGVHTASIISGEVMPRLVVLGVKPQKLDEVAPTLRKYLDSNTILVSILAGVEIASLRARFPDAGQIVRAMPNLPVSEGRGVVALTGGDGSIDPLFALLGTVVRTDSEAELAAIGSLAGAGPAYVARFIAALAKAGAERGLDPVLADTIALETVLGTAAMAKERSEPMEEIAVRVASPNGTTEAGLRVLDHELDRLIASTLEAASRRGEELAAAARIDLTPPLA